MRARTFGWLTGAAAATLALVGARAAAQAVVEIDAVANQRERTELHSWIDSTMAVLRSPQFEANMNLVAGSNGQIYRNGDRNSPNYTTVAEILQMLSGTGGFRLVPVLAALTGDEATFGALTGWIGATERDGSQAGSMTLPRGDLARWRSADPVVRSCAINTLAHEATHSVSTEPVRYILAVTDRNRFDAPAGRAAASYLVGTVAQCTWLQQQGRVAANGLSQCVAVFGTRHFNNRRCNQFGANQQVQPRAGLPAEATDAELDNRGP